MGSTGEELSARDVDQLRILSICHYVLGGLTTLCGFFPVVHLSIGIAAVTGELDDGSGRGPPPAFGWMFIGVAFGMMLVLWTTAALMFVAGKALRDRRRRVFCIVTAGLACLMLQPLGTVLGVFTILVLVRPSVRAAFEQNAPVRSGPIAF